MVSKGNKSLHQIETFQSHYNTNAIIRQRNLQCPSKTHTASPVVHKLRSENNQILLLGTNSENTQLRCKSKIEGTWNRMENSRLQKKLMVSKIAEDSRSQGGQKKRWHDLIYTDLKKLNTVDNWKTEARSRIYFLSMVVVFTFENISYFLRWLCTSWFHRAEAYLYSLHTPFEPCNIAF